VYLPPLKGSPRYRRKGSKKLQWWGYQMVEKVLRWVSMWQTDGHVAVAKTARGARYAMRRAGKKWIIVSEIKVKRLGLLPWRSFRLSRLVDISSLQLCALITNASEVLLLSADVVCLYISNRVGVGCWPFARLAEYSALVQCQCPYYSAHSWPSNCWSAAAIKSRYQSINVIVAKKNELKSGRKW